MPRGDPCYLGGGQIRLQPAHHHLIVLLSAQAFFPGHGPTRDGAIEDHQGLRGVAADLVCVAGGLFQTFPQGGLASMARVHQLDLDDVLEALSLDQHVDALASDGGLAREPCAAIGTPHPGERPFGCGFAPAPPPASLPSVVRMRWRKAMRRRCGKTSV